MNRKLLRATADAIEAHPKRYDQGTFATKEPCGTMCCIAGWALIANGASTRRLFQLDREDAGAFDNQIAIDAKAALGLTEDEADNLFEGGAYCWPEPYATQFQECSTRQEEARVAVRLLRALAAGKVKL